MTEEETYIVKSRDPLTDIILLENKDALAKFLDQPLTAIVESITGALASGPTAWMPITGRIVQGALKGKLFQEVSREIEDLRKRGKISDDFAEKKYGYKSWVELLTILDEETPDRDRIEALKAMFYAVNKVNATDGERIVSYQLFHLAKKLTSGELLLLRAIFDKYESRDFNPNPNTTEPLTIWAAKMANRQKHLLTALVLRDERALVGQALISARLNSPNLPIDQQVVLEANARLTDLGIRFCTAIKNYEIEARPDK